MKLIVGLGNPGKKYEQTRHNTGFLVIDIVAGKLNTQFSQTKFHSFYTVVVFNNEQVMLLKPQTYMNLSGEAVSAAVRFFKIKHEDILIITDDLDLPVGKIRVRASGSAGGQKGLKSIMDHLSDLNIPRLRVGIGKNPQIDTVDYVLGKVEPENRDLYQQSIHEAADTALLFIKGGVKEAVDRNNGKNNASNTPTIKPSSGD
ncbi:MAG: aminoacyl-tRNA hydrolase [Erysipelotrichaceae bacterium]|nr:aminoacyl-tRNA hydrolase [Erysipelotrichaceae bacterium]